MNELRDGSLVVLVGADPVVAGAWAFREPTVEELIAELDRLGAISHIDWKSDVPAPYDIEIPDFVNRHGGW